MHDINKTGVRHLQDIAYVDNGHCRQNLDLLIPESREQDLLPVIVYIHGGAYRTGDKATGLPIVVPFVESGQYAAVSINYRYSSDAIWPAQIHDCKAALRWIRNNAEKYGIDSSRIGVWGCSAGGHLAVMLGTSNGVRSLEGEPECCLDVSSKVSCVVDFYGPTDFFHMDKFGTDVEYEIDESPAVELFGGPIEDNVGKIAGANPMTYINGDEPPFLIVHGTGDSIVPYIQSELLSKALRDKNNECIMVTIEGGGHGEGFGEEVTDKVWQFFDHYLRDITLKRQDTGLKFD